MLNTVYVRGIGYFKFVLMFNSLDVLYIYESLLIIVNYLRTTISEPLSYPLILESNLLI